MLSKICVKNPYIIIVGVLIILILSMEGFRNIEIESLPATDAPCIAITTLYEQAGPETVEQKVTKEIENAVSSVQNVEHIRSISQTGISTVILELSKGTDIDTAVMEIRGRIEQAMEVLPDSTSKPNILKMDSEAAPVIVAAISTSGGDSVKAAQLTEEKILPQLKRLEGVAYVQTMGAAEQRVQITLHPEKIEEKNIQTEETLETQRKSAEEELKTAKEKEEETEQTYGGESMEVLRSQLEVKQKELNLAEVQFSQTENMLDVKQQESENRKKALDTVKVQESEIKENYESISSQIENTESEDAEKLQEQKKILEEELETIEHYEQNFAQIQSALLQIQSQKDNLDNAVSALESEKEKAETLKDTLKTDTLSFKEAEEKLGELDSQKILELAAQNTKLAEKEETDRTDETLPETGTLLTVEKVKEILTAQNFGMSAEYIEKNGNAYYIWVGDTLHSIQELESLPILELEGTKPVYLSDVADICVVEKGDKTYAEINGKRGVLISVQKETGYSDGEVCGRIQAKLRDLEKENSQMKCVILQSSTEYMETLAASMGKHLFYASIFLLLVIGSTLRNLRAGLLVMSSVLAGIFLMLALLCLKGGSLNFVSLSVLAAGTVFMIDGTNTVLENIHRIETKEYLPVCMSAVKGARQYAGTFAATVFVLAAVFLPEILTGEREHILYREAGRTAVYVLIAATFCVFAIVPVLYTFFFKGAAKREWKFSLKIEKIQERISRKKKYQKAILLTGAVGLLCMCGWIAFSKEETILPEMESSQFYVRMEIEGETERENMKEAAEDVARQLSEIESVGDVGFVSLDETLETDTKRAYMVQFYIQTKEKKAMSTDTLEKEIEKKLQSIPYSLQVQTMQEYTKQAGTSGITVEITGDETETVKQAAEEVKKTLAEIKGTEKVTGILDDTKKEVRVTVQKEKAALYNLTVEDVYRQIEAKMTDYKDIAAVLETADGTFDVMIKDMEKELEKEGDIQAFVLHAKLENGSEKEVPLKEIAVLEERDVYQTIRKTDGSRYMQVTAQIQEGYRVKEVKSHIQEKLNAQSLPDGCKVKITGGEAVQSIGMEVWKTVGIAGACVYFILAAVFQSFYIPFLLLFSVGLAYTGGFLALIVTGQPMSTPAVIGFLILSGIMGKHVAVLIKNMNQFEKEGMNRKEAILCAEKKEMCPAAMTTAAIISVAFPAATGIGAGMEVVQPAATVLIGGLLYGMVMILTAVPCIFELFHKKRVRNE